MNRNSSSAITPGIRFHPTDEELVLFYLKRKAAGKSFHLDLIAFVDIYNSEPWDLPCQSKLKTKDLEWYFFCILDRRCGKKTHRATALGYWKTTGNDRAVKHNDRIVGMKKTLVYHGGRAPHGKRTNWVMHEYRLDDAELAKTGILQTAFVLCRIFQKRGAGPRNGERNGAPFREEEWNDNDDMVPVPDDDAVTEVAASDSDFHEINDLVQQKLDIGSASESTGSTLNFYHGECSSYPEHSQEFTKDQNSFAADTVGIFEPQNSQFLDMPEQHVDNEPIHDGNPPNFNISLDELYLDASDVPMNGDGLFLEINDLVDRVEPNLMYAGPSGTDMLKEYLADYDADISQYHLSFDSPQVMGSGNAIPEQGPAFIQPDVYMECQHDFEANSSTEVSSLKQNPESADLVSGNTHPFIKQASQLLDSIPASPAFASELPPEEVVLRLRSAVQSFNSAHVTTDNMTLKGYGVGWKLNKNRELDVDSAAVASASGLLSGKTAFLLSHIWVLLMFFSAFILSLSFKIGSFLA